ncbi:MAG TPA: prolyl aminopeptidase [Methylophilaceae bacterium]|jgi:proline iminopeptidase
MNPPVNSPLFPELEPYHTGFLAVSTTHSIYYEECGNPDGMPVVVLHGGPGSGCNPGQRRYFDPAYYRIILFDQRGCGRSLPPGNIEDNTTQHLAEDMERLREHLDIQQWLIFGGSWGSTLALFYASIYSERVKGLLLRGIFLASPAEIDWFLYDVRQFFPDAWEDFVASLSAAEQGAILGAYSRRIFDAPEAEAIAAAKRWNAFESAIMRLIPDAPSATSNEMMVARLRVHLHYLLNNCFLPQPLLGQIDKLRRIPTIIVHGRYDMVCPIRTAFAVHRAWPEAEFNIVADAGHAAVEPGTQAALVAATERFKNLIV